MWLVLADQCISVVSSGNEGLEQATIKVHFSSHLCHYYHGTEGNLHTAHIEELTVHHCVCVSVQPHKKV